MFEHLEGGGQAHQSERGRTLSPETVILAIASVWQGLSNINVHYSYGELQLFTVAHSRKSFVPPVPVSDILLIPLFFDENDVGLASEEITSSMIHQWPPSDNLFIAAERDEENKVRFNFLYSKTYMGQGKDLELLEELNPELVKEVARNIVRECGWFQLGENPVFHDDFDRWIDVPSATKTENRHTLGHHMVLNAWAYMLDVQFQEKSSFKVKDDDDDPSFYDTVESMIEYALQGRLDGATISQFMLESYYTSDTNETSKPLLEQRITDGATKKSILGFKSINMSQDVFQGVMHELRRHPQSRKISSANKKRSTPAVRSSELDMEVPKRKSRKSRIDEERRAKIIALISKLYNKGDPYQGRSNSPPNSPARHPEILHTEKDWRNLLLKNLETYEALMAKMSATERAKLMTVKHNYYVDQQVVLAIAAVWKPIFNTRRMVAFGTDATFSDSRSLDVADALQQWVAGRRPIPLILPLRGHGENFTLSTNIRSVGHWALAIAKPPAGKGKETEVVDVHLLNSTETTNVQEHIFAAAENVTRHTGWLGMNQDGLSALPYHGSFVRKTQKVPYQKANWSCGLHVVISAWAIILKIPIMSQTQWRGGDKAYQDFCQFGTRVINCALAGFMDTRTIQAFLNTSGFARPQDINDNRVYAPWAIMDEIATDAWHERAIVAARATTEVYKALEAQVVPKPYSP